MVSKNCDKFITPTVRVSTSAAIFFVMQDLSNDHDVFDFFINEQDLSFENRLRTIIIEAQTVNILIIR